MKPKTRYILLITFGLMVFFYAEWVRVPIVLYDFYTAKKWTDDETWARCKRYVDDKDNLRICYDIHGWKVVK